MTIHRCREKAESSQDAFADFPHFALDLFDFDPFAGENHARVSFDDRDIPFDLADAR